MMLRYTLLLILTLVGLLAAVPANFAQTPRIQVVQEGGCSDADPFFRIRGQAMDLPADPNLQARWTLPGPPPELRDNHEFLDLSDALNTDRTYVFELIDLRNGASIFRAETTLTLRRPLPVEFAWSPDPICYLDQEVLFQVLGDPSRDYVWNVEGERTGSRFAHRFSRTGSFTVEVFTRRDGNGCPTPPARRTVVVLPDPKPSIEVLSVLGCSSVMDGRAEYTFVVKSQIPAADRTSWMWTFDRSHPVVVEGVDTLRVRLPSGLFEVQYDQTSRAGCMGQNQQQFNLTTREHPLPTMSRVPDNPIYCAGETVRFRNTTTYLEERHRGNTALFRFGRPWVNPFIEDHEYTTEAQENFSVEVRIYDHVRIGTQQCIWTSPPVNIRFEGPPPDFDAQDRSRGICSVPATSEIRIRNLKPDVRYIWTIFDEDDNVVPGFPRTVTNEELLAFQVTQMPQIYAVQLEEETAFGCRMRRIKPAFVISAGNLEADFVIKDPNPNPDFLFCRLTPAERVRFVSTSRPRPHGLRLTWYYYTGQISEASSDDYTKIGEGDSIDWAGVSQGIESIKLRISNYDQCKDSTYRERAVTFIAPDWGVSIDPPAGCAPKTHRITAFNKGSFPPDFPVITSFTKMAGNRDFRIIDDRTIEVDFTDNQQAIQIQFNYGFENVSCGNAYSFWLASGVSTQLGAPTVGCVGSEGFVTSVTNLANPPTRFLWLVEGEAQIDRIEETENRFRFVPRDNRPFRIGQQVFLENETEGCSSDVIWTNWVQADDFPIELEVVGDAEKECIPALFNFNLEGRNIRQVRWNWGNGSPEEITLIPQAAQTYNDSLGGIYQISVEAQNDLGCISRDTVSVRVLVPLPTFQFTPDTRILCNGEQLLITNETEDPILNLLIDWGDEAPILSRTQFPQGETLAHCYRWTGDDIRPIVIRYVVDLGKCRPVVGIRPLEIQPPFSVRFEPLPALCLHSEVVATAQSRTSDLVGYRWELLPETAGAEALRWAAEATASPQNQLTALKPGRWPVRVVGLREIRNRDEIRQCEAADTAWVEVLGTELSLRPIEDPNPCYGTNLRIESDNTTGRLYRWTIGSNPPVETGRQPWIDWTFDRGGLYDILLEVIDAQGCTLRVEAIDLIAVEEPVWLESPVAERERLCPDETLRVRTPGLPDATPVHWRIRRMSDDALLDEGLAASTWQFTLEWPLQPGLIGEVLEVELLVENSPACLSMPAFIQVEIPRLVAFQSEFSFSKGPCPPTQLTVRLMNERAQNIRWDSDADGEFEGQGPVYAWNLDSNGGLQRRLGIVAENEGGCPSDTILIFDLNAKPEIIFQFSSPVCVGTIQALSVVAQDSRPWREVRWNIDNGAPEVGERIERRWPDRGQFPIGVSAWDNNGCIVEARSGIEVQGPIAGFEANHPTEPDTLFFPPTVQMDIRNRATGASRISWTWDHLGIAVAQPNLELPRQAGRYSLLQVVEDNLGCVDSLRQQFIVEPVQLQLSNVFTPNGDGVNDIWQVVYSGEGHIRVWVYDRTGVLVFQTQGQNIGWDGRFGGREVPAGVYYWRVQTPVYDRTGSLTLVR